MRQIREKFLNRYMRIIMAIFLMGTVFLSSFLFSKDYVKADSEIITVAYVDHNGFIKYEDGKYTGYGVDYLEEIGKYTGWNYEYVYYPWREALNKVESGEVDLICTARKIKHHEARFLYTEIPLGYESTILYTLPNGNIYYEDYESMDRKRVGLISGGYQILELAEFAKTHNFTYRPYYYSTAEQLEVALKQGKIDMMVLGSLSARSDLKAVKRFGAEAYYCATGKENQHLVDAINEALYELKIHKPNLETQLNQKYYKNNQISSTPLYTEEESNYIKAAEPIHVKLPQGYIPYVRQDFNEKSGLLIGYLDAIAKESGLEFVYDIDSSGNYLELSQEEMENMEYLMVGSTLNLKNTVYQEKLLSSESIFATELSYIRRKSMVLHDKKEGYDFAMTPATAYLADVIQKKKSEHTISYYPSAEKCLEAVLQYDAEIAILDAHITDYYMQKPKFEAELYECTGDLVEDGIILLSSHKNQILIDIINKTIDYITNDKKDEIMDELLFQNHYRLNMLDVFYTYRGVIIVSCIVLLLVAYIYVKLVRKEAEARFEKMEYSILQKKVQQDDVTGTYNRIAFYEKARDMIENLWEDIYIIMMDISNFKVINDLYGMENGDRILREVAQELMELGKGYEFVLGRFTGDHFYMCLRAADFIKIDFPGRFKTFLDDMDITVTYGVYAVGEQKEVPINIMCDWASIANHANERQGAEYIRFYSDKERQRLILEQEIESEMEKAITERQFCTYVQPKYDIFTEKIVGGEALVRWKHPQKGMVSPGIFISIFEKNGFIIKLDYYVWEDCCRLLSEMKSKGMKVMPISINVSRIHLYSKELKEKLLELIATYGLVPDDLQLEITETVCAEDSDNIYKQIRDLRDAGFTIAMDDFGSGYSSLNMLKEMPIDILKMDLRFLQGGGDEEKGQNILQTLISLAKSLDLDVVVEGVETKEQVEFLRSIGSHCAQGFYYSKPVESAKYKEMLEKDIL